MNTFIFDMDGLMFDTERIQVEAFDYAGEKIGIGKAGYMVVRTIGMTETLWRQYLRAEFGEDYDEAGLLKNANDFIAERYRVSKVPVKKGLYRLLEFLKDRDCRLAVASSSHSSAVIHHLEDAGIIGYFSAAVGGDMIEKSKPDPEIYIKACELLHRAPVECYALEDSPSGIRSASTAGCKVFLVPDLWQPTEEYENDYYKKFNDLDEVCAFLTDELR